jgi:hypothetical protein
MTTQPVTYGDLLSDWTNAIDRAMAPIRPYLKKEQQRKRAKRAQQYRPSQYQHTTRKRP